MASEANIYAVNEYAMMPASENGHLEVVEYLASPSADFHTRQNYTVRYVSNNSHYKVVKFFASLRANIHACKDLLIILTTENEIKIVEFLLVSGAHIHMNHGLFLQLSWRCFRKSLFRYCPNSCRKWKQYLEI